MNTSSFTGTVSSSIERVGNGVLEYLPNLMGAILLLLVGWLLAYLLGFAAQKLVGRGLHRLARTKTIRARVQSSIGYQSLPKLIGRIVFWSVLLFFLAASVEAMGLPAVSNIIGYATAYLPRVLAGILIMFAGFWVGELTRGFVARTAATVNTQRSELIGRIAQVSVLALAAILAVDQLGLDNTALVTVLLTVFATTLGAAALAFGLGARQTVSNIISSHYFRQTYRIGDRIRIGEIEGTVVEQSAVAVTLDARGGKVLVPYHRFSTDPSVLVARE